MYIYGFLSPSVYKSANLISPHRQPKFDPQANYPNSIPITNYYNLRHHVFHPLHPQGPRSKPDRRESDGRRFFRKNIQPRVIQCRGMHNGSNRLFANHLLTLNQTDPTNDTRWKIVCPNLTAVSPLHEKANNTSSN